MNTINAHLFNLTQMKMNTFSLLKKVNLWMFAILATTIISCNKDEEIPDEENDLEVITDVSLIFTNTLDDTDVVTVTAEDPDGIGSAELTVDGPINLDAEKTYVLTFTIENHLAEEEEHEEEGHDEEHEEEHSHGFDIAEEIEEEAEEHQFFFSFTNDAFSDPTGNGNIDNAADEINYNDEDSNGNPLGLSTNWTTGSAALADGTFTVRLQHQPEIKTATSGATDGDTDFELTFELNIQ